MCCHGAPAARPARTRSDLDPPAPLRRRPGYFTTHEKKSGNGRVHKVQVEVCILTSCTRMQVEAGGGAAAAPAAPAARDSLWAVVPSAGKDAQGDEWFAFGSPCGVVGMVEKGDAKYAGMLFRSGGEGARIFCCMREGDVGEAEHFSVPLWGLGTPQGAMGGQPLAPGVALGSACWRFEDGGSGVVVLRHSENAGLGIHFLPKEGKIVYMCPDGVDLALVISPRSHPAWQGAAGQRRGKAERRACARMLRPAPLRLPRCITNPDASLCRSLRRGPIECPKELAMAEIANLGAGLVEEEDEESEEEVGAEPEEEWPALGS